MLASSAKRACCCCCCSSCIVLKLLLNRSECVIYCAGMAGLARHDSPPNTLNQSGSKVFSFLVAMRSLRHPTPVDSFTFGKSRREDNKKYYNILYIISYYIIF